MGHRLATKQWWQWRRRSSRTSRRWRWQAADLCAGTQSIRPVYRSRKNAAYIPLDKKEEVFSAALQKTVKNIPYDIMQTSPEETMAIIVRETKRCKRGPVLRIKLGEVRLSVPCNTFCKLG
jgi:hypothetical protein